MAGAAGAGALYVIAAGRPGFDAAESGFATNGYGSRSPGGYSLTAALVAEVVPASQGAGVLTILPGMLVIWFVRNHVAKGFALGRV